MDRIETHGHMIFSPDVLLYGLIIWGVINLVYFALSVIERRLFNNDRLSRSNMIIFFQLFFVSMSLLLLDGERLNSAPALIFISGSVGYAIIGAILNSNEKVKLSVGKASIETGGTKYRKLVPKSTNKKLNINKTNKNQKK